MFAFGVPVGLALQASRSTGSTRAGRETSEYATSSEFMGCLGRIQITKRHDLGVVGVAASRSQVYPRDALWQLE